MRAFEGQRSDSHPVKRSPEKRSVQKRCQQPRRRGADGRRHGPARPRSARRLRPGLHPGNPSIPAMRGHKFQHLPRDDRAPFAHSRPGQPFSAWEPLDDHLRDVGSGAAERAERFGWAEAARVAGHLHDIGKVSAQFQAYIRAQAGAGGDHATAGAREAIRAYPGLFGQLLALIVAGHHSGLADPDEIERRLASDLPDYRGWEAHAGPLPGLAALKPTRVSPAPVYPWIDATFSRSFLARMLFSCLVDADFIATETFVNQAPLSHGGITDLATLRDRLRTHMTRLRDDADPTELNRLRAEILDHAVAKAGEQPGFFTLTVPTGGGKTLASLLFALEHAVLKSKRRVVVVIPFTAIIEQTAEVYREILGDDAVLEHHASFDWEEAARAREDGGTSGTGWDACAARPRTGTRRSW